MESQPYERRQIWARERQKEEKVEVVQRGERDGKWVKKKRKCSKEV